MADNAVLPFTGTGDATATIALDEIGGVKYQRVKVAHGADGAATDTSSTAPLPVSTQARAATAALSNVSDSASSVTLLASNASRLGATIFNDSASILYVKLGATATTTSFTVRLPTMGYYEVPFGYTGVIDGIWSADSTGAARMTEMT